MALSSKEDSLYKDLKARVEDRSATVGVIGLGYVGLPLVIEFCNAGFRTLGFDIDTDKVEKLNAGKSYIGHIESESVKKIRDGKRFEATADFARLQEADVIIICVPTPLKKNREPDLSYVLGTAKSIVPGLREGQLVILESTTYPGTTENELRLALEKSGLAAGKDFYLAFSPEREDPGNTKHPLGAIPKVIGGYDEQSLKLAQALYTHICAKTIPVSNARTAEAVKLTENIFRSVNIALVNELKIIFSKMGIDIWDVIEAAKTKPFGFMPFYPGPGLGGHCIPIDPFYLSWRAREFDCPTRFIELAGEINTAMPDYVVNILGDALNERGKTLKGSRILLVGMAYKKDVDDVRESPGLKLHRLISGKKASVDFYDLFVRSLPPTREYPELRGTTSIEWNLDKISAYDAVVIVTDHSNIDYDSLVETANLIIDCRNATKDVKRNRDKIIKA